MSFLEDLRRQKAAKEAEMQINRQKLLEDDKRREEADQTAKRERNRIKQLIDAAKAQFDESGIKALVDELLRVKPDIRFGPKNDFSGGTEEKYKCELILDQSSNFDGSGHIRFIEIDTASDGTITFRGGPTWAIVQSEGFLRRKVGKVIAVPLEISIGRDKWIGNRDLLEDALGKVYENPKLIANGPHNPAWGERAGSGM
ncbi:MAG: hypothetical protein Q7R51_00085 [bacterium]|nr:hypothetical protein [bacterium]